MDLLSNSWKPPGGGAELVSGTRRGGVIVRKRQTRAKEIVKCNTSEAAYVPAFRRASTGVEMAIAIAIAATISVERNIWTCDRQEIGGRKAHTKLICVEGHGLAGGVRQDNGVDT